MLGRWSSHQISPFVIRSPPLDVMALWRLARWRMRSADDDGRSFQGGGADPIACSTTGGARSTEAQSSVG